MSEKSEKNSGVDFLCFSFQTAITLYFGNDYLLICLETHQTTHRLNFLKPQKSNRFLGQKMCALGYCQLRELTEETTACQEFCC